MKSSSAAGGTLGGDQLLEAILDGDTLTIRTQPIPLATAGMATTFPRGQSKSRKTVLSLNRKSVSLARAGMSVFAFNRSSLSREESQGE